MTPYEPSFVKDLYQERLAQAEAERFASKFTRKSVEPTRRHQESRGVNGLLAWSEGQAILRRAR